MSPVRSGFRAVLRQPAVIAGEIAWRWAFGAATWALLFLTLRHIVAGVDVSEAEYALARQSGTFLIADACVRVLIQVLPQLARAAVILVPALTLLWIIAATCGRAATLRALIDDPTPSLRSGQALSLPTQGRQGWATHARLIPLLALNGLRAVFTLATVTAFLGTVILVSRLWPQPEHPVGATLVWLLLAALVAFFWSVVNWFLSLAPVFIVRDRRSAAAAIADSLGLYRQYSGSYASTAFGFGFMRGLAFIAALVLAMMAAAAGSTRAGVALTVLIALIYFAAADFLCIARLAAFLAVAAAPAELVETPLEQ